MTGAVAIQSPAVGRSRQIPSEMWGLLAAAVIIGLSVAPHPPHPAHRLPKHLPPGFEEVLPADIVKQLKEVHESTSMTPQQQHEQIDKIMSAVPGDILNKLPLPPFLQDLPADVRAKVEEVHRDTSLSWKQRHEKIHTIIESLPPDQRPHPHHGGPGGLPPGFKEVLPKEIFEQFKAIQDNGALTSEEKHKEREKLLSTLSVEIVDKLPLPPPWYDLPKDTLDKIKEIRRDMSLTWEQRHEKIHSIIDELPENLRPHFPHGPHGPHGRHGPQGGELPPGFENVLPQDVMNKVYAIRNNSALSDDQKRDRVEDILSSLPVEVLKQLPLPPFFKNLPDDVREKLTKIHRDTSLSWRERHEKIFSIVNSLPEDQRPHFPHHPSPPLPPRRFKEARTFRRFFVNV